MEGRNIKFNRLHDELDIEGESDDTSGDPEPREQESQASPVSASGIRRTGSSVRGSVKSVAVVLGMFCLFLVISYNKWDINTNYSSLMTRLNLSARVQDNYKTELRKIGTKLNIAWRNLSTIEKSHDTFKKIKPWIIDINDAKADLKDKLDDAKRRLDKTSANILNLNISLEDVKRELKDKTEDLEGKIESAKNVANQDLAQITNIRKFIQDKIGDLSNTSRDLSVAHKDMQENVYQVCILNLRMIMRDNRLRLFQMLADLDMKQEIMEEEIESNALDQSLKLADLQTEILKLETALNMTVSGWAEMRSGHGEFANKTLAVLATLMKLAKRVTTESPTTNTIDDIEAEDEEDVTPAPEDSPSSTPLVFHNCTDSELAKFKSSDITCSASSEFNRKFR